MPNITFGGKIISQEKKFVRNILLNLSLFQELVKPMHWAAEAEGTEPYKFCADIFPSKNSYLLRRTSQQIWLTKAISNKPDDSKRRSDTSTIGKKEAIECLNKISSDVYDFWNFMGGFKNGEAGSEGLELETLCGHSKKEIETWLNDPFRILAKPFILHAPKFFLYSVENHQIELLHLMASEKIDFNVFSNALTLPGMANRIDMVSLILENGLNLCINKTNIDRILKTASPEIIANIAAARIAFERQEEFKYAKRMQDLDERFNAFTEAHGSAASSSDDSFPEGATPDTPGITREVEEDEPTVIKKILTSPIGHQIVDKLFVAISYPTRGLFGNSSGYITLNMDKLYKLKPFERDCSGNTVLHKAICQFAIAKNHPSSLKIKALEKILALYSDPLAAMEIPNYDGVTPYDIAKNFNLNDELDPTITNLLQDAYLRVKTVSKFVESILAPYLSTEIAYENFKESDCIDENSDAYDYFQDIGGFSG